MSLTSRKRRFVNEYLVELNAAKAAMLSGYSPKSAKSKGSRLLTNVDIQIEIKKRQVEDESRLKISRDLVLSHLESAFELARSGGDARGMIRAAAEINKMMGYT